MRPEAAHRRIEAFRKRFGEAHLYLAYHAAFPLALTPDLLYRLWANFQRDIHDEVLNIPWIAVADLLLSSLCDEVGNELYEMEKEVRSSLLSELKINSRFGFQRINELSDFLLAYIQQQIDSPDIDTRDFAQAQKWTALAYRRPSEAVGEIATALSRLKLEDRAEWVRMTSFVETIAEPLAKFNPLLIIYAQGMGKLARGDLEGAVGQLGRISLQNHHLEIVGVTLPVPEQIEAIQRERLLRNFPESAELETVTSSAKFDLSEIEPPSFNPINSVEEATLPPNITTAKTHKSAQPKVGHRLVITPVGISLFINQIDSYLEPDWSCILQKSANINNAELRKSHANIFHIIRELKQRAEEQLYANDTNVAEMRESSAELNGIYGLYQERLEHGRQDIHWLIAPDTALAGEAAKVIQSFLENQGIITQIYQPPGLSVSSTSNFKNGIDNLLAWFTEQMPVYREAGFSICFNLTGGFKAIQQYMNTVGMVYADEIITIDDSRDSELIKIPRIPMQVDISGIEPFKAQFALMAVGAVKKSDIQGIPETFVFIVDDEATLSTWGKLIWNSCKQDVLVPELLNFPYLVYEESFISDYRKIRNAQEKIKLQETLAKVSYLLTTSNGDHSILSQNSSIKFSKFLNHDNIYHFRVTHALRVSCTFSSGVLRLRNYGSHNYVFKN